MVYNVFLFHRGTVMLDRSFKYITGSISITRKSTSVVSQDEGGLAMQSRNRLEISNCHYICQNVTYYKREESGKAGLELTKEKGVG